MVIVYWFELKCLYPKVCEIKYSWINIVKLAQPGEFQSRQRVLTSILTGGETFLLNYFGHSSTLHTLFLAEDFHLCAITANSMDQIHDKIIM